MSEPTIPQRHGVTLKEIYQAAKQGTLCVVELRDTDTNKLVCFLSARDFNDRTGMFVVSPLALLPEPPMHLDSPTPEGFRNVCTKEDVLLCDLEPTYERRNDDRR